MVRRGSFSFVAMLVINPVVILFYQNCSMIPSSQARQVASVAEAAETKAVTKAAPVREAKADCVDNKGNCPVSDVE